MPSERVPSFIIGGAQKSASTLLHRCLAEHPDVYMPSGEVGIFEDPRFAEGIDALRRLYRTAPEGAVLGMKRAELLGVPICASRIRAWIPEARLLFILRNPVDRAISAYYQYMRSGFLPLRPLEDGLNAVLDSLNDADDAKGSQVITFGYYARHLRRYATMFSDRQLLVLLDDDLTADGPATVRRAYDFIGVGSYYVPKALASRPQTGVYAIPRLRYLRRATRIVRATATRPPGSAHRSLLSPPLKAVDRYVLARLFRDSRPQPSQPLRQRLLNTYSSDIRDLEGLLGRDLAHWQV